MTEYIDREALGIGKCNPEIFDDKGYANGWNAAIEIIQSAPAADVVSRDEGIKIGAELAAMHGATPTEQALEKAYFDGLEYGMKRRDVRPVVTCADCEHNNACLTQAFVEDCGKIPFDRNTFFCADGERKRNA